MNNLKQSKHFLLAKVCLWLFSLLIFIALLENIIPVWANNPLKEILVTKKVIEKRKYLEESNPDNKLVDCQNADIYDSIYDANNLNITKTL
ncbi:hypothetical protein M33023_00840 [Candidatus Phytoplasma asteris]|uniref:Effector n=1 Tax=Candidatus Phytoplasma asteris TaxID=85620 RepID=A0ABZ2YEW3_9MOLU|nr:hypothetical protein [Aster yellows witches'-broom phytoplasma]